MNAIVANDLTKKYAKDVALRAINLELPEGKIMGLIAPKNAGKTTLVRILSGLTAPTLGTVSVFEYSCTETLGNLRSVCSMAASTTKLYGKMCAMDNVIFFGKISGIGGTETRERASVLMHGLGIWEKREQLANRLDTASYRKLAVATALITNPRLIILDEIAEGLNSETISDIYSFIQHESEINGLSALITSDTTETMNCCDLFVIMQGGEIRAKGNLDTVRKIAAVKSTAAIKTVNGELSIALDNFTKNDDGYFIKRLEAESDMTDIIERAVHLGNKLLEARVIKPNLKEIYEKIIETDE